MQPHRRRELLDFLSFSYPNPRSELNFKNEYELIICVVLSAQCTDKKVNQVTPILFTRYPTFPALAAATLSEVEQIIRPINYFKTKSRNIIALAHQVCESFKGIVPRSTLELILLPGVGRKTANVVAGELGDEPTLAVDTHVFRLAHRLGLSKGKGPDEVEEDLKKQFPSHVWRNLHHWLILHGRRICVARSPRCSECVLNKICPFPELKPKKISTRDE